MSGESEAVKMEPPVAPLSCDICQIGFSGPEPAQQHYASQKHRKQALGVQMGRDTGRVYDFDGKTGRCYICCVAFTSQEDAHQHLQGRNHKLQETRLKVSNEKGEVPSNQEDKIINRTTPDETVNILRRTDTPDLSQPDSASLKVNNVCGSSECVDEFVYDKVKNTGYCNLCKLDLTSYNHAYQHLNGAPHQKKRIRSVVPSLKFKPVESHVMIGQAGPQKTGQPDGYVLRNDPFPKQANPNLLPEQPNTIIENRMEEIEPISYDDNMQYSGVTMATSQKTSRFLQHVLSQGAGQINQFQYAEQQPKNFATNMYGDVKLPQPVNKVLENAPDNLLQNQLTNAVDFSGILAGNASYKDFTELYDLSHSADNEEFAFDCRKNNGSCKLCDIALTSDVNAKQHLLGERHQKKKIRSKQQIILGDIQCSPTSQTGSRSPQRAPQMGIANAEYEPTLVLKTEPTQYSVSPVNQPNEEMPTQQALPETRHQPTEQALPETRHQTTEQALPADNHQTTLIRNQQPSDRPVPHFSINTDVIDRTQWYNCDVCQKPLNSLQQMEIHQNSPRHKRQEAKMNATRLLFPGEFERNLQSSNQRLEELTLRSGNDLNQPGGGDSSGTVDSARGSQLLTNEVKPMQESYATQDAADTAAPDSDKTDP